MNTTQVTGAYLQSARELLQAGLAQMERDNPKGLAEVRAAAAAGAVFQLRTGFSTSGHIETVVEVIGPNGEAVEILALEMAYAGPGRH